MKFSIRLYICKLVCKLFRAGDHVTFIYDITVSQQMVFAIFDLSFKILLIYTDHVPGV